MVLQDHDYAYFGYDDMEAIFKKLKTSRESPALKKVCVSDEFLFDAGNCREYSKWIVNLDSTWLFEPVQECAMENLKAYFGRSDVEFVRSSDCKCKKKSEKLEFGISTQMQHMLAISDSYQFDRLIRRGSLREKYKKYTQRKYGFAFDDPFGASDANQASCADYIDLKILDKCKSKYLPDGETPGVTWGSRADDSLKTNICAKTGSKPSRGASNFVGCFKESSSPIQAFGMFYEGDSCSSLSELNPVRKIQNRMINFMLRNPEKLIRH